MKLTVTFVNGIQSVNELINVLNALVQFEELRVRGVSTAVDCFGKIDFDVLTGAPSKNLEQTLFELTDEGQISDYTYE